jgi:2-polyprenyl-6-methoxyphenol hydroxylase-like FAD-dependent oxidoreductase
MPTVRKALIIGSGIAGPATAIALQKAGIDAALFEARQRDATGAGAFLTVASNGVDALRVLDAQQALAASFDTPFIVLRSSSGKYLGRTRTGIELPDGVAGLTITRSDLYQGLHDEAARRGIDVQHSRRLVGVDESASGVLARFADGTEAEGDVLIGCDGVHSTVRELIDPHAPKPAFAGLLTTGGYASGVLVDTEPGSYEMIFGKRAFFGYVSAPDGSVWWFANVPRSDEPARGGLDTSNGDVRQQLIELFDADAGPAVALIEATDRPMPPSAIHTLAHLPNWHRGRSIVIGDAAHAPSPTSGQGASLSIEDALVLAKCLRDLPGHQQAFEFFVAQRRPRVEQITKWAARINSNKAPGRFAAALRDLVLPPILKLTFDSKASTQQFSYRVDWNSPVEGQRP